MAKKYFQQLGLGVASLTFGVALSIFIYVASTGLLSSMQAILLYVSSFLLMLRFWWRYTELFVQNVPSDSYIQFLFDFLISFFGILAVLFINNIQIWSLLGVGAMLASMIRCSLSWKKASKKIKKQLKNTIIGSVVMAIILGIIYFLTFRIRTILLSEIILVIVILFVAIASIKKK